MESARDQMRPGYYDNSESRFSELEKRLQTIESNIAILAGQMNALIPAVGRLIEELKGIMVVEDDDDPLIDRITDT